MQLAASLTEGRLRQGSESPVKEGRCAVLLAFVAMTSRVRSKTGLRIQSARMTKFTVLRRLPVTDVTTLGDCPFVSGCNAEVQVGQLHHELTPPERGAGYI